MGRFLDYARNSGEVVPNATETEDGFMSAADKAKLDSLSGDPTLGRVAVVDSVNGNDATANVNGTPFLTVAAAISAVAALGGAGYTIWVLPGTYTLAAGITIPAGCSLRGLSTQTVTIQLAASASATLLTMGENTRVEDCTFKLTSSSPTADLVLVALPGNTTVTSKIRTCVLTADNSGVSAASTTNVYGLHCTGTGTLGPGTFSFNQIKGSTINIKSNGGGLKAGIYQPSSGAGNQISTRDLNIYVSAPVDDTSVGLYVGVYTDNAGGQAQLRSTSVSGAPWTGVQVTNTEVKVIQLTNQTVNGSGVPTGTPAAQNGVTYAAGDRILLAGQTTGSQNGIWVLPTPIGGAWSRASDMAAASNANGALVPVSAGTYALSRWLCVSNPATVGTSALTFTLNIVGADVRLPVRAAFSTNLTLTGALTAQGITFATGDRILAFGQTTGSQNGIYIVNTAGAWTRAGDLAAGAGLNPPAGKNCYLWALEGTYMHVGFLCSNAAAATVGTTALTFSQVRVGADVWQNAPQAAALTNGVQIGPGTDLVTKTAAAHPFTSYVYPTTLIYALNGNIQNGTYYLWPGVQAAGDNTETFYRIQQRSICQGMSVNLRSAPGNVTVTVTVLKSPSGLTGSGVPTPMTVTFTDGQLQAFNYTTSVDFAQGEYLALQVKASGGVNNADMVVELDLF
jgi:hypothetical protein